MISRFAPRYRLPGPQRGELCGDARAVDAASAYADKVEALLLSIHELRRTDPEQFVFASVARDEAPRYEELREIGQDKEFEDLFAEIIRFGVKTGDIASSDAIQARGALAATTFGIAMLGADMTVQAHALAVRGAIRALTGTLLTPISAEQPQGAR